MRIVAVSVVPRMALRGTTDTATIRIASFIVRRRPGYFEAFTSAAVGAFGTSETTIQTLSVTHGPGVAALEIFGRFQNVSGADKTAKIRIYAGSTLVDEVTDAIINQGNYERIEAVLENPSGIS